MEDEGKTREKLIEELKQVKDRLAHLERKELERQRAEEALKTSRQDFSVLVNSIDGIVWEACPRTFRFSFVSQQAERLLGYPVGRWLEEPTFWKDHIHPDDRGWAVELCTTATKEKRGHEFEYRMIAADERTVWLRDIVTVVVENGQPVKLRGVMVDITERKQAEEALAERERHAALSTDVGVALTKGDALRNILQQCAEATVRHLDAAFARIWTLDQQENVLELQASAGMYTHINGPHGRVPVGALKIGLIAELRQPHLTNAVIGDPRINDQDWAKREGMVAFAGHPLIVEDRLVGVMAMFARKPLTEATLNALASVGDEMALGIERKWAEEAVWESEERYRKLSEAAFEGLVVAEKGVVIEANQTFADMFGYELAEIIGKHAMDLTAPESRELVLKNIQSGYEGIYEIKGLRKDGSTFPVEAHGIMFHYKGRLARVTALRDIAERKRAEEEVESRVRQQAVVSELGQRALAGIDPSILMDEAAALVAQTLGVEYCKVLELLPNGQALLLRSGVGWKEGVVGTATVGSGTDSQAGYTLLSSDPVIVEDLRTETRFSGPPLLHEHGVVSGMSVIIHSQNKPFGVLGVHTTRRRTFAKDDAHFMQSIANVIAEAIVRKRGEEEIERSLSLHRATLEATADGILVVDREGKIVSFNRMFVDMWRIPEPIVASRDDNQALGFVLDQLKDPEGFLAKVMDLYTQVDTESYDILEFKDGRIFERYSQPQRMGAESVGRVWSFRDVTERKRMEQDRLRASKLESLGVLAGGIAHDFNNILTAIAGNISLARMYANPEDKMVPRLAETEKAIFQAKALTHQLLTFAKGGAPIRSTTSLSGLIKDSCQFALRGSNVRCEFSIPCDLWPVEADEGQMNQVFSNLIINADQAMPDGGTIRVRCENVPGEDEGTVHGLPLQNGKYVRISIQDQGIGIVAEHLRKIFDPYFTTKQIGSGLGLATTYSIVKNHDGHIGVESEMGVGTTFYLYLPASQKQIPQQKEMEEIPHVGHGRILVMDDEEVVRDVLDKMLKNIGYEVDSTKDGVEATERYRKAKELGQPFDAVIMDLTIPGGMGGEEAMKKLLEIDPAAKAIVSSGYSDDPVMADFRQYGFSGVVPKPYNIKELSKVLHNVLGKTGH